MHLLAVSLSRQKQFEAHASHCLMMYLFDDSMFPPFRALQATPAVSCYASFLLAVCPIIYPFHLLLHVRFQAKLLSVHLIA